MKAVLHRCAESPIFRVSWSVALLGCLITMTGLFGCRPLDIDDVGGYRMVYELEQPLSERSERLERTVAKRLSDSGFANSSVQLLDDGRLMLEVAGAEKADVHRVKRLIETGGHLEFRILAKSNRDAEVIGVATSPENAEKDEVGGVIQEAVAKWFAYDPNLVQLPEDAVTRQREEANPQVLILIDSVNLSGAHIAHAADAFDSAGQPCIAGEFSKEGAALMMKLSSMNLPEVATGESRALGIILDHQLIAAPRIISAIGERFQLSGAFTRDETETLAIILRSGELPVAVIPETVQIERIDPQN